MKEILYRNAIHERETYWEYRNDYKKHSSFQKKYDNLIHGLDAESIEVINKIISRMEYLFTTTEAELDLFDDQEKKKIKELQSRFYPKIISLEDGIYCYENYFLPGNYFDPFIYYDGYSLNWFSSYNRIQSGNILDVGAYIGDSALFFSNLTKGQVYALDAIDENCIAIEKTINLNRLMNVQAVCCAVGKTSEQGIISKNEKLNWSTMHPYAARSYVDESVFINSLDDFVADNNISVDLLKLHVEGNEFAALEGAKETIKTYRPLIIVSIYHNSNDFWNIKPYLEDMQLGYRFKIIKPINGNIMGGTVLLGDPIFN